MHAAYGGSFSGGSIRAAAQRCPCLAEPEGTGEITCKLPVERPGGAGPAALRGEGGGLLEPSGSPPPLNKQLLRYWDSVKHPQG